MKKRESIAVLRATIQATLTWFKDGTSTKDRSPEENAVIADMRKAMKLTKD